MTMTREEAIDVLKKNYPDSCYELLREAVDVAIEALKQPEPKKGKWECDENGDWHCSVCRAIVERDEQINHYWQYCYHCGAKMEGETC